MAEPADTNDVGTLIVDFLRDAQAGRTRDPASGAHTAAALRSLRRSLDPVDEAIGRLDASVLREADEADLERIGRQVIDQAALPPSRLRAIEHALRSLSAYSSGRRPAEPLSWTERSMWPDRPPRRRVTPPASPPDPPSAPEARSPTFTMLALGAHVSSWIERFVVIAFVLTAIGLAIELV
jgi:hypothetical protein